MKGAEEVAQYVSALLWELNDLRLSQTESVAATLVCSWQDKWKFETGKSMDTFGMDSYVNLKTQETQYQTS